MSTRQKARTYPLIAALSGMLLVMALAHVSGARASEHLIQTVPTPTPRTVPPVDLAPTPQAFDVEPPRQGQLALRQEVEPQDVLPGEELEFSLWLTNTSSTAVQDIVALARPSPHLRLLEIRATQGAAEYQAPSILVHLGTIEAEQTALVIVRAKVQPSAQAGQIILNQFSVLFEGGETRSNVVAAGLPPNVLPTTGQDRRIP